jgi:glycosyltransferase involved in cell wall biosynthesis
MITSSCFSPLVLTWTRRIAHGNLKGLIKINEYNFDQFKSKVGSVDIIHAQATYPGALIAKYLSDKYQIPYVVTIRMSPFPFREFLNRDGTLQAWIETPLKGASQLIATSHSLKNTLQSYGLHKVTVVNNPVDTILFQPTNRLTHELQILSVGRLERQKGYDLLIQAIAQVKDTFNGKVRIGGDGSQGDSLHRLAKKLGVEDKFEWLGELTREQVLLEMEQCSFYVLSSRHETFGNVLLEAMACGKAVISTRCGGPLDIVNDQVGILCEPNDAGDLSVAIEKMINKYRDYSPENIRQHVLNNFSPEKFSKAMKKIYQDAISRSQQ